MVTSTVTNVPAVAIAVVPNGVPAEGTVFFVTHDHDVIDEVATRIWHFEGGHIDDFKGPYEEFMVYAQQKAAEKQKVAAGRGKK